MVIKTNEHEFQGRTLQEYLEWKYPTTQDKVGVKEININVINYGRKAQGITERLEGSELDLREYVKVEKTNVGGEGDLKSPLTKLILGELPNLETLECSSNQFTYLDLSGCPSLKVLGCADNQFISVDFLNSLPNPEKLKELGIFSNRIQSTDIVFFSKFVNIECLKIGTMSIDIKKGKHNKFCGSLKSWQNLIKLESICIEATDVNEGLEYLPESLAKATKKGGIYMIIECKPHDTQAKCKVIQEQLRPFNYDLQAWQLTHPEKMLISKPEYFTNPDSRKQWLQALNNKIIQTQQELQETKTNLPEKTKRIQRLSDKLASLEGIRILLEKNKVLQTTTTSLQNELQELKERNQQLAEILGVENDFAKIKETIEKLTARETAQIALSPKKWSCRIM